MEKIRLAHSPEEYKRFGVEPGVVSAREDRMHVDGSPGTFEWWFMKADFDGTVVANSIATSLFQPEVGLRPMAGVVVHLPDGTTVRGDARLSPDDFESLSDEKCDIRAGVNRFQGDLHVYRSHIEADGIIADIELKPTTPAWRPEAGHLLIGDGAQTHFGWLIPVQRGDARIRIRGKGLDIEASGTGYIDRGWMNTTLSEFLNDWHWYRADFNEYTLLAVHMTYGEKYGLAEQSFFMVFRGSELLAGGPGTQNAEHITFTKGRVRFDEETGAPVPEVIAFEYREGSTRFVLSAENATKVEQMRFADFLPGDEKEKSRASTYNGVVVRFTGPAEFSHYKSGKIVEKIRVENGPFYESMNFGIGK